jgi:hypothetical protein
MGGGNMKYRMEESCEDCPFNKSGPGAELRRSLRRGRFKEICAGLKRGEGHNTSRDGSREAHEASVAESFAYGELLCAGGIEWQSRRGIVSDYLQICERLFGSLAELG